MSKNEDKALTRREFTVQSALAMLAGVSITVSGCSDSKSTPASPTPAAQTDASGTVSANHGHVATVTAAQLTARGALMLNIQGTAAHPHTVELTADEVTRISNRTQVSKQSTTDNGHSHMVTFN